VDFNFTEQQEIRALLEANSVWVPFCGCKIWEKSTDKDGYGAVHLRESNIPHTG
jgi:hypothetical protein